MFQFLKQKQHISRGFDCLVFFISLRQKTSTFRHDPDFAQKLGQSPEESVPAREAQDKIWHLIGKKTISCESCAEYTRNWHIGFDTIRVSLKALAVLSRLQEHKHAFCVPLFGLALGLKATKLLAATRWPEGHQTTRTVRWNQPFE